MEMIISILPHGVFCISGFGPLSLMCSGRWRPLKQAWTEWLEAGMGVPACAPDPGTRGLFPVLCDSGSPSGVVSLERLGCRL